ncbi:MAG: NAD(P)H-dependent oxidoreductase [Nakamurella sp.]
MPTLLHLDSSADLTGSVSRALSARFAANWIAMGADHLVIRRDLHSDPLPHLPTNALHWAHDLRTSSEVVSPEAAALQDRLIQEVINADTVVVGAPMYNWSVPSTLKAWIDYLHVPGVTSPFAEQTQAFVGKPIVLISSRGDRYGPDTDNVDLQIPVLEQVFGRALGMQVFLVVVELTLAERIPAMAPLRPQAADSLDVARATIDRLAKELGAA